MGLTAATSLINNLWYLFFNFHLQDYEVQECLKQLMMSLLRAYRFSPIIPDLGLQVRPSVLHGSTELSKHASGSIYQGPKMGQ